MILVQIDSCILTFMCLILKGTFDNKSSQCGEITKMFGSTTNQTWGITRSLRGHEKFSRFFSEDKQYDLREGPIVLSQPAEREKNTMHHCF